MFIDRIQLKCFAGKGGNGVIAWRREKYIPKGGPSGGDGGHGASIFLKADENTHSLQYYYYKRKIQAENGGQGSSGNKKGKNGKDLILKVPLGTILKDQETKEILFDFTENGQTYLLCKGGKGGKGNSRFKTPTNQAPYIQTNGTPGEEKAIEMELKLIADIGLIGFPNAGKSTLFSKLSKINVKIADYPFTTLHPNLGLIEFADFSRIYLADIPGIIENAHHNKGLGLEFLRHIERTNVLIYVIDSTDDPVQHFHILRNELKKYNPDLLKKDFLIVLNKIDNLESEEITDHFKNQFSEFIGKIFCISALEELKLSSLLNAMQDLAQKNGKKF